MSRIDEVSWGLLKLVDWGLLEKTGDVFGPPTERFKSLLADSLKNGLPEGLVTKMEREEFMAKAFIDVYFRVANDGFTLKEWTTLVGIGSTAFPLFDMWVKTGTRPL